MTHSDTELLQILTQWIETARSDAAYHPCREIKQYWTGKANAYQDVVNLITGRTR